MLTVNYNIPAMAILDLALFLVMLALVLFQTSFIPPNLKVVQ